MSQQVAVLNVVGLTPALLTRACPRILAWASARQLRTLRPCLPAVTCSVQASMLTGLPPSQHGIVGNGWYDRSLGEVHFWKQSNRLVAGEKVWEAARRFDPTVTCANLFWWFNMHSTVDWSVTPRPIYAADGRKFPDLQSRPIGLRQSLQNELGPFPLHNFWGPGASIESSRWIAAAAMLVHRAHAPRLTLVYLPHLDYDLQRLGPDHPRIEAALAQIDTVVGDLLDYFAAGRTEVILLSEYGIVPVTRPVYVNRALREARHLSIRDERGHDSIDLENSRAFVVADHQIAHVYVASPADLHAVAALCGSLAGVDRALDRSEQHSAGLAHQRAGDLVLVARPDAWFTYDFWLEDHRAPDYARTVDIHRKPGYDPRELFFDPAIRWPRLALAGKLLQLRAGFRTRMNLVPLDPGLVRGSHGRDDLDDLHSPLLIASLTDKWPRRLPVTAVWQIILEKLIAPAASGARP